MRINDWSSDVCSSDLHFTTIVPDLPGYGDSDLPSLTNPVEAEALAAIVAAGLDRVVPPHPTYHLVGFSFGGIIGGPVAVLQAERVETLPLFGAGGMPLGSGHVGKCMKWRALPRDGFTAVHEPQPPDP